MNPTRIVTSLLIASLLGIPAIYANNGAWSTTASGNWSDSTKWTSGTIADGAGFTASFSAPTPNTSSPIVTITSDENRIIGGLNFSGTAAAGTHNFILNGPGVLTLSGGTPAINVTMEARTVTLNATLAGESGTQLTVGNNTNFVLGGTNTYTGLTDITAGVVTVNHAQAFGSTNGETTLSTSNGAIKLNNGVTVIGETLNARGNGTGTNLGALHTANNAVAEWAGNIRLDNTTRFGALGASSELKLSGVISDGTLAGAAITFSYGGNTDANGTVILSGANTYTGNTSVTRGTLKLDAGNNRLPTGTTLTIGGGASNNVTVDLNGYDQTVATLRSGTGAGVRTLTNAGASDSTFTVNQASGTEVFDGVVSGDINFVKSGAGVLNLTGLANTFTGNITVNAGTLGIYSAFINGTADVSIAFDALFALNFVGSDSIGSLYLGGAGQDIGTYGAIGSGAQFESSFFTGTGILNVTTSAIPEPSSAALAAGLLAVGVASLRRRRR